MRLIREVCERHISVSCSRCVSDRGSDDISHMFHGFSFHAVSLALSLPECNAHAVHVGRGGRAEAAGARLALPADAAGDPPLVLDGSGCTT